MQITEIINSIISSFLGNWVISFVSMIWNFIKDII